MQVNFSPIPRYLEGYNPVEWPDLSSRRNPTSTIHHSYLPLPPGFDIFSHRFSASILSAVGRIIGSYCGVSDVLLCSQVGKADGEFRAIRLTWSNGETWGQVISSVEAQIGELNKDNIVNIEVLRTALSLKMPCLALFTLSSNPTQSAEFPFTISLDRNASSFCLSSRECTLHPSFASLILGQLRTILEYVVLHDDKTMSSLPDFPSDLTSFCEAESSNESSNPPPKLVMDYLSLRARTSPSSTAFYWLSEPPQSPSALSPTDAMSYLDWHIQSNKFARWLVSQGLGKDEKVCVCMQRDRYYHVAIMGIMRAGLCYVPIDPELPPERKKYISTDAKAQFVLTTRDISEPSLFGRATVYVEDNSIQQSISEQVGDDFERASSDSLAYLLYTSGTTGNPKGCLITHQCLVEAIWAIAGISSTAVGDIEDGRYLATASIAFDVHLAEVFVSLALGLPLFNIPRSTLLENLPYYVLQLGITHLGLVPSLIEATLSVAQAEGDLQNLKLRYLCSGGEKITDSILDNWAGHPMLCLANFYGPSEVTIGCCARIMDGTVPKSNIGKTFSNVSGYVVDENMSIVPTGAIGELVVGGPLVGIGYQGRQDLTDRVFLEWPNANQRAYRTGDLVRMMPDSTFEILGRIDTQVKLRGVRIESEGVSSIIRKAVPPSPGFTVDAMTILSNHPKIGTDQLVSFIAWDPTVAVSTRKSTSPSITAPPSGLLQAIKTKCDTELASYMRPSHVIPLTWLPMTSNGKADAKTMAHIFLDLELDTLIRWSPPNIVTSTQSEADAAFRSHPRAESSYVESFSTIWLPEVLRHYRAEDVECILPAFPAQEGILSRSSADNTLYVQTIVLSLKPSTPIAKFKQACESTVSRHQILRSLFYFSRSLVQVVFRPSAHPLDWTEKQISSVPAADFPHWFATHEAADIARSINDNSSDRPLFRFTVYTSSSQTYVVFSLHHSLFDGASLPLLLEEFDNTCLGLAINLPTSLSKVLAAISTTDYGKAESFWRTMFEGFSWLSSPFTMTVTTEWEARAVPFKSSLTALRNLASQSRVTLQALLTRTFAEQLAAAVYHRSDLVFGIIRSGRLSAVDGIETVLCPMISVQPIRIRLQQPDILNHIHQCLLDSIEFEHVGLGQIQGWVRPGLPLFDAVFSLAVKAPEDYELFDLLHSKNPIPDFPLAVEVLLDNDSLSVRAAWLRGAISNGVVTHILETFENVALGITPASPSSSDATLYDLDTPHRPPVPTPSGPSSVSTELTVRLRSSISTFLNTPESQIGDDTSLISLGLDSLKSVGLSRILRKGGLELTANHLMSKSSISELAQLLCPRTPVHPAITTAPERNGGPQLRSIISSFLGVDESVVGEDTSLISLGLDSLKAVGLSRALHKEGLAISATQLMSSSSVRKLATVVGGQHAAKVDRNAADDFLSISRTVDCDSKHLKLAPEDHVKTFPVTDLQAGMLSQTIASRGRLYVHAFPLLLFPQVETSTLHEAWKRAVSLLSILRTSFHFSAEHATWFQAVHSIDTLRWSVDSFRDEVDYVGKIGELTDSLHLVDERSFCQPPLHIRLYTSCSNPSDRRLVLVLHHALYDGISFDILMDIVTALYRGQNIPPIVQFIDLLPTLRKEETLGTTFWLETLRGFTKLDPPQILSGPASKQPHIVSKVVKFDASTLASVISNTTVTVQCIAQAALASLLSSVAHTSDVLFGHVVSGRAVPQGEEVIGPLLNAIPCRIKLSAGMRNRDLLKAIHASNVAALPFQHLSLRTLQRSLNVKSLWDVLFVFQPLLPSQDAPDSLWKFDNSIGTEAKIQYPLTIEIHQHKDHFVVGGACRPDYMESHDFAAAMDSLCDFISGFIYHPDTLLHATPSPAPVNKAPSNVGEKLSALLANMTGSPLDQITSHTPLAALGIDSITAIQLAARGRKQGLHMLASDISTCATVGELAQVASTVDSPALGTSPRQVDISVSVTEADAIRLEYGWGTNVIEKITIASAGIKWLVGAWQRSRGTRFQHVFAYALPTNVDSIKLRRAWVALVARHEVLRTTVACMEGSTEPRLVTFKADSFNDHWSEEQLPPRSFHKGVLERMKELVANPPDLNSPPTRAKLFTSTRFKYIVLRLHHFQYDAWSLRLLLEDLSRIYLGGERSISHDLHSFLCHSVPDAQIIETQKAYWQTMFPSSFRPVFFPRQVRKFPSLKRSICTIPSALPKASLCKQRAASLGVSLQALLLACWAQLQAQYTAHTESTFGLWHSGRRGAFEDIESLAVPCMNVLPLRVANVATSSTPKTAQLIEEELRRRTAPIEQSDLTRIDEWAGKEGKALCNVFVNIVKLAPDLGVENVLFEPVHAPYWVPDSPQLEDDMPRLAITDLIQDDLMVDIVTLEGRDTILMSVDASARLMDQDQAREVIERWAILAKGALGIV